MNKYDQAYMRMAFEFSKTSAAVRRQVGCLIVKDNCIVAEGVNGTPPGWPTNICEDTDGYTKSCVVHAEMGAINKALANRGSASIEGANVFVTLSPCADCALALIKHKVKQVVFMEKYKDVSGLAMLIQNGIFILQFTGTNFDITRSEGRQLMTSNRHPKPNKPRAN